MHITRVVRKHTTADGVKKEYVSVILRRSYREGRKVRSETLANLTALPDAGIEALHQAISGTKRKEESRTLRRRIEECESFLKKAKRELRIG